MNKINKSRLIWGIICLVIAAGLTTANLILPSEDLMFQVGSINMPWIPPVVLAIVGIILLASLLVFGICLFCVVSYALAISSTFALIKEPILKRDDAIISFMLAAAALICLFCKIDANKVLGAATFKSGMSACVCVLGVAWLGTTFVTAHIKEINVLAANLLTAHPWMLAVVLFFAAMLLYSQAATTKALMPAALALGRAVFLEKPMAITIAGCVRWASTTAGSCRSRSSPRGSTTSTAWRTRSAWAAAFGRRSTPTWAHRRSHRARTRRSRS